MVPKVLCATFNHRWGNVTTVSKTVTRPISAVFSGERRGREEKLDVVCEQIEIVTSTCDGCGSVKRTVLKSNAAPVVVYRSIDTMMLRPGDRDNPLGLVCSECAVVLRTVAPGHDRTCWKCNPPDPRQLFQIPPESNRGYFKKWAEK